MWQKAHEINNDRDHRIIESLRLEKTYKIIQSNHLPITNSFH